MTANVEKSNLNNPIRVENPYKGLDYNLLHNIPTVDGKEVKGDMTTQQLIGFDKDYVDNLNTQSIEQHNQDENSHPPLLNKIKTLRNDLDDLGEQVSGIEEKIPESASGINNLVTKQQLLDTEANLYEDISNEILEHNLSPEAHKDIRNVLSQKASKSDLTEHIQDLSNPHEVTKTQVGLGNVDNTSDLDKPISSATQNALNQKASNDSVAELETQLSRKQDDTDFHPEDYGWPDIRPAARPKAIVIMAGVKADYSAYNKLGFLATCENGYSVFIDGVHYDDFSSNEQCSITWSQYSATTGFTVNYPLELQAHIIQIIPKLPTNDITHFKMQRVTGGLNEYQGCLWLHFNITNEISLTELARADSWQTGGQYQNNILKAITAFNNELKVNNLMSFVSSTNISYLPTLILSTDTSLYNAFFDGLKPFGDINAKKIVMKDGKINTLFRTFYRNLLLEKVDFCNCSFQNISELSYCFYDCRKLKRLPNIDCTEAINMSSFLYCNRELKDTFLDLSYAQYLDKIGAYGTLEVPLWGLKSLLVSNQAPFEGTSPQIDVSYTGLDKNALLALFDSLPTVNTTELERFIRITGAVGANQLSSQEITLATDKGWIVTR